ncbi:E3 ubiquitin-protein ligase RBBP6 [Gossypium australe]|uniref:E3 ubiquitin-protein ligase RBBP6 n=1 Tax=Gossypium australe TaxID=47621 RepID=A0A5B6VZ23_9ROSI|nr:E3 ubiquitin-protein ligase RBBP6 [Gossypium australe]
MKASCLLAHFHFPTFKFQQIWKFEAIEERITWDFFQAEFRKKYISQRFIDQKRKEFLELKQGRLSITEYEREFVRLSQYARECVSTEATMCKRFIEGLNEDINFWLEYLI